MVRQGDLKKAQGKLAEAAATTTLPPPEKDVAPVEFPWIPLPASTGMPKDMLFHPAQPGTITPGYKTSEFWVTLASQVLTALMAGGVIPHSWQNVILAGLSVLGAMGFTVARTAAKRP